MIRLDLVLLTALGVGGATLFGSALGFIFRNISHKFSDLVLSFAAGVMLSAAILGLILPAVENGGKFGLVMAIAGIFVNAYVMLPFFSKTVIPMETIIAMGTAIHPAINNVLTFCLLTVAPFNVVKGVLVSIVTILIYKKISILLKGNH